MLDNLPKDRIVTSHELAKELNEISAEVFSAKTGFPTLDRILEGVEAGELIIVTGPTGEGKTSALMSITKNMIDANVNSVWFTLEVTPRQFLNKLVKSSNSNLPLFYIPHAGFDDVDLFFVKQFEIEHRRRFEMIDWIEIKIKEAIERARNDGNELRAVFIDHIHQIFSISKVERNISLELGDMVAKIKQLAIKHNLVIFLIAHTKDDPQGTMREPRKEDIRDSGLISRLADTIIGVWRVTNDADDTNNRRKEIGENDNKAKIRVFKNRRTGKLGWFFAYHCKHYLSEKDIQADNDLDSFVSEAVEQF